MGHLSYAGAMAAVLVVGIGAIGLMTPGGNRGATPSGPVAKAVEPALATEERILSLAGNTAPKLAAPALPVTSPGFAPVVHQPRYIMDSRPVSYEPSSSFNF